MPLKKSAAFCPVSDKVGGLNSPPVMITSMPGSAPSNKAMFNALVMTVKFLIPLILCAISVVVEPESRIWYHRFRLVRHILQQFSLFCPHFHVGERAKTYEPDLQYCADRLPHDPER